MTVSKLIFSALISQIIGSFVSLAAADEFIFSPEGSQYSAVFPGKPTITVYKTAEGDGCVTHDAILKLLNGEAGLRAEATVCSNPNVPDFDEQDILEELRHHAEISGVTEAIFQADKTPIGYVGMYRGVLAPIGNTFVYVSIVGEESGLALVGSAPHSDFWSIGFEKFKGSIRKLESSQSASGVKSKPQAKTFRPPTFKVDVDVSGSNIKTLAESYLKRELRQLGDVELTETDPDMTISLIVLNIGETRSEPIGYAIAVLVIDPLSAFDMEGYVQIGSEVGDQTFSGVEVFSLQISTPSAIQQSIAEIVAEFDVGQLEPTRQMFRRLRETGKF